MRGILIRSLILGALLLLPGCAALLRGFQPPQAKVDLEAQGIRRVAVVEFADLTQKRIATDLSRLYAQALKERLGNLVLTGPVPRPGAKLAGSWLKAQGKAKGVEAFVTGTVTGYQAQPEENRVCLSMTVRLLDAETGSILWSKHTLAFAPLIPGIAPEDAFREAIAKAAKEFAHDFQPPSS